MVTASRQRESAISGVKPMASAPVRLVLSVAEVKVSTPAVTPLAPAG
jgi:hypothetical protein